MVVATLFLKMGLRGMLICYFVKIEMYLAAEIIIINQIFFSKNLIYLSTTTWIILSFVFRPCHIIKYIRYSSWLAGRIPIYGRSRIVLDYSKIIDSQNSFMHYFNNYSNSVVNKLLMSLCKFLQVICNLMFPCGAGHRLVRIEICRNLCPFECQRLPAGRSLKPPAREYFIKNIDDICKHSRKRCDSRKAEIFWNSLIKRLYLLIFY